MSSNNIPFIHLCVNCLNDNAVARPIGDEKGSQMDPIRATIDLCIECWDALQRGDMITINQRYKTSRTVNR